MKDKVSHGQPNVLFSEASRKLELKKKIIIIRQSTGSILMKIQLLRS